jgi:ribosomal protein S18 acetylase RimI-like enzyme
MAWQLIQVYGWLGAVRFVQRSRPCMGLKEAEPDDYYVFSLAVHPDYQNNGIGWQLLAHAERKARAAGLPRCVLGVTIDNDRAIRFYERHGYRYLETVRTPVLEKKIGYKGYQRMAKNLPRPALW